MKRTLVIGALAAAIVTVLGLTAFSFANAASGFDKPAAQVFNRPEGHEGKEPGPLGTYMQEAAAEILGVSVEELEEARGDREAMEAIFEAAGLTPEAFKEAMETALPGVVEQALEDEAITAEQAETILENGLRRPGRRPGHKSRRGFGPLNPYVLEVSAEILGMEVEDVQAAIEDGTSMKDLIKEADVTLLDYRSALDEATPGIVEQALEDGEITEEQAERILENGLWPSRCRDGHRGPRPDAPSVEG